MLRACKQSSHKDSGMHEGGRPDCNWLQQGSWSMRVAWSNRMDEEGSIGTPGTAAQRGVAVMAQGTDVCKQGGRGYQHEMELTIAVPHI